MYHKLDACGKEAMPIHLEHSWILTLCQIKNTVDAILQYM